MITQNSAGDLSITAGDSGTLKVSGLDITGDLTICLWIKDSTNGKNIYEKHIKSNQQDTAYFYISSTDSMYWNLSNIQKSYSYGITAIGEVFGKHTIFPAIGVMRKITVYPAGCMEGE